MIDVFQACEGHLSDYEHGLNDLLQRGEGMLVMDPRVDLPVEVVHLQEHVHDLKEQVCEIGH